MRSRAQFRRIEIDEAQRMIEARKPLILDVRDPTSYARGHIPKAQSISDADIYLLLTGRPKHLPVLIYCYHGNASQTYAQTFVDFGFLQVFSLEGGFDQWRQVQDAPIATSAESSP